MWEPCNNLCTAPSTAGTAGQGCTAGLGWRVALEGHEHHAHRVRCALSTVSASETLFVPLVEGLLQEIFCFCGNLSPECFPPTLGRSSGLFIRIPTFLKDLNSVPCVLGQPSNSEYHSAQRKVFRGEMQGNPEFVSVPAACW